MTFDGSATVENLALQLFCELGTESYEVRYGWPPKPLDFSAKHISLVSLNMNGETLTIVMDQPPADTTVASDPGSASQDKKKKANTKTEISKKEQSNDVGDVVIPYSDREGALGTFSSFSSEQANLLFQPELIKYLFITGLLF